MHKKNIIISLIIVFLLGAGSYTLLSYQGKGASNIQSDSLSGSLQEESNIEQNQEETKIDNSEIVKEKIATIRKRLALKGLIIEGDAYYREGQLALALTRYLNFYKQNPDDILIVEKIADTYYEMKKFGSAINYYKKIQDPSEKITERILLLISYQIDFNEDSSIQTALEEIQNLSNNPEQVFYYTESIGCSYNFHECKKTFGDTFWPEESATGVTIESPEYKKLYNIKDSIQTYRNFQSDDVSLKDAFIIASWYKDGLYSLSAYMGEQLLQEKSDYKPILKIVAQSYFELGDYKKARGVLGDYYKIDDEDPQVNYMLGIINTQLREYLVANIYLRKSLGLSADNSLDIRRQLIHNFHSLDNQKNILIEFKELVKVETEYTATDLSLGIYNHILAGEYDTALDWSEIGIEKFPEENQNFYAYIGWIQRENQNFTDAQAILQEGIELYPENPFILINLAYTAIEQGFDSQAVIYLKQILISASESEFAIQAQSELDTISQK